MKETQKYVPLVESTKSTYIPSLDVNVQVPTARAHRILFVGDQKTAARARGAQMAKVNSTSPSSCLAGFVPAVADWHTKVILLQVRIIIIDEIILYFTRLSYMYIVTLFGNHECFMIYPFS